MSRSFLFQASTDGHLGYFQILAIVNNAATNIEVLVFFQISIQVSSDIIPEVELLGQSLLMFLSTYDPKSIQMYF